ncbi:hypothetical protein L596_004619 [Steinernema carpocapsae]|uniref:PAP-associated domain-containing protein n=1 Tax=Steinernema carpocapsae TaxID=34508 RepID=A0A4U8UZY2_STECR|nr:hypothetical protein L596_004619 [Steinernema carpocapsae]
MREVRGSNPRASEHFCFSLVLDQRVSMLFMVVKHWAKSRGLNDTRNGTFSTYSLALMVIHYLQCGVQPAILPEVDLIWQKGNHEPCLWSTENTTRVDDLLVDFFDYFANQFNFRKEAINVRAGKRVSREEVITWKPEYRSQWQSICIQDPFTLTNMARCIYKKDTFVFICAELKQSYWELARTRDLHRLLSFTVRSYRRIVKQHIYPGKIVPILQLVPTSYYIPARGPRVTTDLRALPSAPISAEPFPQQCVQYRF